MSGFLFCDKKLQILPKITQNPFLNFSVRYENMFVQFRWWLALTPAKASSFRTKKTKPTKKGTNMKTKHFFLTAFAVIAIVTAAFSNIFSAENKDQLNLNYQINKSADTTDSNPGGGPTPPIGR